MSEPSKAVFISYASQDAAAAQRIRDTLRSAGLEVWFDRNELRGGDAWDASIRQQIKECALFMPVISANTNARSEAYFRLEWKLAVDRSQLFADDRAFLLPVVIEDTSETAARVPERFRERQWSRLIGGDTPLTFIERVKRLLSDSAVPAIARSDAKPVRRSRLLIAALLIVAAASAAGFYIFSHRSSSISSTSSSIAPTRMIAEKSIAVLPFVNTSEDKANDYFSDGISEELLNLLAKIPQLKVTARVSSFSFKGKDLDVPEIARRLHVAHVLEGSVRKAGDQVRITAQLIHAADGFHMWSETYDRKLDDIFKIQDEVAGKVVKELKVSLLQPQPKARTTDPKAYALYLQGKQLGRPFTADSLEKSDALLHQALDIDPRYAPAWQRLAVNFISKADAGTISGNEGYVRGREAVEKALAIDQDYAPAHALLGVIAEDQNDLAGAAKHFERALTLDPTDLDVLQNAAIFLSDIGRVNEALALQQSIVRRDPVNPAALNNLGYYQRLSGRYDEAIASARTALSLSPSIGSAHSLVADALLLKGDAAGALHEIEQEPNEASRMIHLPMFYHALGRRADSDNALAALIAKYEKEDSYSIAVVYAFRGEADQAFAWLDKALEHHEGFSGIVTANLFDKIHSDPRWLPFLRKIGNAPEQLAKIKFKVTLPP